MSDDNKNDIEGSIPSTELPSDLPTPTDGTDNKESSTSSFSTDDLVEMLHNDEPVLDDTAFNSEENFDSGTTTENKPQSNLVKAILFTAILSGIFLFLYTDIFTSTSNETSPEIVSTSQQSAPKTQRLISNIPTDTNFKRERTLTQINESEKLIETISAMKRDLDNLRKYGQTGDRSQKALRDSQAMIIKSLEELHRLTSAKKLSLDDGAFLEPLANGKGYTIVSGSGIRNTNETGTFIAFVSGTILKDKDESSLIFAFTNDKSGKTEISNIFKITPRTGLTEITRDHEKNKIKDIVLNDNFSNDRIDRFDYENSVIFFNSLGEISATKKFRQKIYSDAQKNHPIKGSERKLAGFETSDYDIFSIKNSTLNKNSKKHSISGFSQDLTIRYVEYKSSTDDSNKFVEILAGKSIIKRTPLENIEQIMFKKTMIDDVVYIYKDGQIFEISNYGERILKGAGRILGQVIDAVISNEKIVLSEKSIKTSTLNELIGNTLYAASGLTYTVKKQHVVISPSNVIKPIENYLMSSKGDLLSANKQYIDTITHFKSSNKSGGRIMTENYIIEIPSPSSAIVLSRQSNTSKSYSNPKIIFEKDEWVVLKSTPDYELDELNKTINGVAYETKEIVSNNQYRFVDSDGSYILKNDDNPIFDLSERTILKEKISNVEKIEGNAFDYIYHINNETGHLKSEGMGRLLLKRKDTNYAVFMDSTSNKSLTEKTIDIKNKQILNIDEFITINPHLNNIVFKTISGDDLKIISSTSILFNGIPIIISSGKFNTKLNIFIFEIDETMSSKEKTKAFNNNKIKRFERTVQSTVLYSKNYYNDEYMVIEHKRDKLIKLTSDDGLTIWTKVYSEFVDLKTNEVNLSIKPYYQTTKPALAITMDISAINVMSDPMSKDILKQYRAYQATPTKEKAISKTLKKEINNTQQLQGILSDLDSKIKSIASTSLSITKLTMSSQEIAEAEEEKINSNQFHFEIGQTLTYNIEKSIEISEGSSRFVYTDLNETHFEDRERNGLSMVSPVLRLEVSGDFNTNQVMFTPIEIVYTDYNDQRQTISIPSGSTSMEYTEKVSDYVLSGVPAYYINQKVKELPTTVMLTTVQGVIEAMSSKDEGIAGALESMDSLSSGGDDSSTSDSFTEGVASGTSEGLKEIIDIYKSKAEGKQDILITDPNLELKSIFVNTTPVSME